MDFERERVAAALPEYEVGEELGRGAWGIILRGEHRQLRRPVAIKQLSAAIAVDPEARRRFAKEAHVLAGLHHPHYRALPAQGWVPVVMDHCDGRLHVRATSTSS